MGTTTSSMVVGFIRSSGERCSRRLQPASSPAKAGGYSVDSRVPQPFVQVRPIQNPQGPVPAGHGVGPEVVIERRNLCLDSAPQRPADVRHQGEETHARQSGGRRLAEVGGAQLPVLVIVVLELLAGGGQL